MKETMDNDNRMKEGMIDKSNMKFENEYARSNPALKEIRDQAMKNARPMAKPVTKPTRKSRR